MPLADKTAHRRHRRTRPHGLAVCGVLVGVALLAAGCGSSGSSPGVANVAATTTASSQSSSASVNAATPGGGAVGGGPSASSSPGGGGHGGFALVAGNANRANELKFSACMRAHGVPNFPDPNAQGVIQGNSSNGFNPGAPAFQAASQKCQKYLGRGAQPTPAQQAQFEKKAIEFSACMRAHGEPAFPDPQFSGGHVSLQLRAGPGGIDPRSAIFQKAQKACAADLPIKGGALPPPSTAGGG